jgi:hypothetical protein
MSIDDVNVNELRTVIDRIEQLLALGGGTPASINPDGTPGLVAPGDIIESAWGNATSQSISELVTRGKGRIASAVAVNWFTANATERPLFEGALNLSPITPTNRSLSISLAMNVQQRTSVDTARAWTVGVYVNGVWWHNLFGIAKAIGTNPKLETYHVTLPPKMYGANPVIAFVMSSPDGDVTVTPSGSGSWVTDVGAYPGAIVMGYDATVPDIPTGAEEDSE